MAFDACGVVPCYFFFEGWMESMRDDLDGRRTREEREMERWKDGKKERKICK